MADRCRALVSVSGYLISSQAAGNAPLPPQAELQWWYQFYFATERGRAGYEVHARFRQADLEARLAAVEVRRRHLQSQRGGARQQGSRRDHDPHYRWRLGLAEGEAKYEHLEKKLAAAPQIDVPTITMEGDANGAPHPDPSAYASKFSGRYEFRLITGGIGHNLPQEAPQAFAKAVIDADGA